jgi:3-phenylpropionate/trans-cinnamate dioxygenase ferredoxin component
MSFVRACAISELSVGGLRRLDVDGEPVVLIHADDGYFALSDLCSHDEVALSDGELAGTTLECWLHGSRFDIRTGRSLCPPATSSVPVYGVKMDDGQIYVSTLPSAITALTQESVR